MLPVIHCYNSVAKIISGNSHVQECLKVIYLKVEWPSQRLWTSSPLLDIAKLLSMVLALNLYFHQQCIICPVFPILPNICYQILTFLALWWERNIYTSKIARMMGHIVLLLLVISFFLQWLSYLCFFLFWIFWPVSYRLGRVLSIVSIFIMFQLYM